VARTLHGLGHLLLELLRSTRQAAGKDLTLLVEEFLEELPVLVIHVFDAELLETAVFLFLDVDRYRVEVKKKKYCRLKKLGIKYVDYKDGEFLKKFLNEQGKILPRRLTGTSQKFQKKVAQAVKRARHLAILPFVTDCMK
jgi:small subunit ribosomal protein S18